MKKLFLAITVIGLVTLTSCKKEEEKVENATEQATEDVSDTAEETANVVDNYADAVGDMPQFSNPEVQKFAEEYAAYFNEVMAAAKTGNQAKLDELSQKSPEWTKKASEMTQKMTAEESQKWVEWSQKIAQAASQQ